MSWFQKKFTLPPRSRGCYLITDHVMAEVPEIRDYKVGLLHLFVQHTSCGLSLNENWDDDVRADMSDALDRIAPADRKGNLYRHSAEGEDDMPVRGSILLHISPALKCFPFSGNYLFSEFHSLNTTQCRDRKPPGKHLLTRNRQLGSHQILAHRSFNHNSYHQRPIGPWNLAKPILL